LTKSVNNFTKKNNPAKSWYDVRKCEGRCNLMDVNKLFVVSLRCKLYMITWIGNTVTFTLFTECNYRDNFMEILLSLIAILIVYIFYWLYAKS
jgi:hypothetical protein